MNGRTRRANWGEWLLTTPGMAWLLVFFLYPALSVLLITFKPSTINGDIGDGWTLDTLRNLSDPNYPVVIWRTVWISSVITALCLVFAVPAAYYIARASRTVRNRVLMLVMIPFLTNFIIRVFAWKVILHPEGLVSRLAVLLGCLDPGGQLLYNPGAVVLVSLYTYLPFAILPVYAAAEKFDFTLMEAAMDLGCRRLEAFMRVFVPGIRQGLLTAALLVFIPNLGSYVIPEIVGGNGSELLGNKIAQRLFTDRNLPHAAGLASLLTILVVVPMVVVIFIHRRREALSARKGTP
ncbi:MAG: ABC transporter permease [Kiritimatiellia bacterium]